MDYASLGIGSFFLALLFFGLFLGSARRLCLDCRETSYARKGGLGGEHNQSRGGDDVDDDYGDDENDDEGYYFALGADASSKGSRRESIESGSDGYEHSSVRIEDLALALTQQSHKSAHERPRAVAVHDQQVCVGKATCICSALGPLRPKKSG